MSIKFLVSGGGISGFFGGECRFYFYGREDFPGFYSFLQVPLFLLPLNLFSNLVNCMWVAFRTCPSNAPCGFGYRARSRGKSEVAFSNAPRSLRTSCFLKQMPLQAPWVAFHNGLMGSSSMAWVIGQWVWG